MYLGWYFKVNTTRRVCKGNLIAVQKESESNKKEVLFCVAKSSRSPNSFFQKKILEICFLVVFAKFANSQLNII